MSSLDTLLAPGFPHGYPKGYTLGCRGHACSGADLYGVTCAESYTRYNGDFRFRRWIDSGWSMEEVVAQDEVDAVEAEVERVMQERARIANQARTRATSAARRRSEAPVANHTRSGVQPVTAAPTASAPRKGRKPGSKNHLPYRRWSGDEDAAVRFLITVLGRTDEEVGAALDRDPNAVRLRRYVLHLKPNRKTREINYAEAR